VPAIELMGLDCVFLLLSDGGDGVGRSEDLCQDDIRHRQRRDYCAVSLKGFASAMEEAPEKATRQVVCTDTRWSWPRIGWMAVTIHVVGQPRVNEKRREGEEQGDIYLFHLFNKPLHFPIWHFSRVVPFVLSHVTVHRGSLSRDDQIRSDQKSEE